MKLNELPLAEVHFRICAENPGKDWIECEAFVDAMGDPRYCWVRLDHPEHEFIAVSEDALPVVPKFPWEMEFVGKDDRTDISYFKRGQLKDK